MKAAHLNDDVYLLVVLSAVVGVAPDRSDSASFDAADVAPNDDAAGKGTGQELFSSHRKTVT